MVLFFGKYFTSRALIFKKKSGSIQPIWQAALNRGLRTATRVCCELDNLVHCVNRVASFSEISPHYAWSYASDPLFSEIEKLS